MAGSSISPRFLQTSATDKSQRNLSNFQVRTGQKFGDIAKQKLFEQALVEDAGREERQARTALEFRRLDEENRRFNEKLSLAQQGSRREKQAAKEKRQAGRARGAIAGVGGGFAVGGPVGAVIGGVIGAVTGGGK